MELATAKEFGVPWPQWKSYDVVDRAEMIAFDMVDAKRRSYLEEKLREKEKAKPKGKKRPGSYDQMKKKFYGA